MGGAAWLRGFFTAEKPPKLQVLRWAVVAGAGCGLGLGFFQVSGFSEVFFLLIFWPAKKKGNQWVFISFSKKGDPRW